MKRLLIATGLLAALFAPAAKAQFGTFSPSGTFFLSSGTTKDYVVATASQTGFTGGTTVQITLPSGAGATSASFAVSVPANTTAAGSISFTTNTFQYAGNVSFTLNVTDFFGGTGWVPVVTVGGSPIAATSTNLTGNTGSYTFTNVPVLVGQTLSLTASITDPQGTLGLTNSATIGIANFTSPSIVPEPSTYVAIASVACLGFVVIRRRREKAALAA